MKFGIRGQLTEVITCVKFLVDRLRVTEFWHHKIVISHWLAASPLQQCTQCRATLWKRGVDSFRHHSGIRQTYRRTNKNDRCACSVCWYAR